jgi:type 1 fimbria pilin
MRMDYQCEAVVLELKRLVIPMKKNVTLFMMAVCLVLLMCSKTFAQGVFSPSQSTIALSGTIDVPVNAAVGTVLWTSATVVSDMRHGAFGGAAAVEITTLNQLSSNTYYPTNIPGVGLLWQIKLLAPAYSSGWNRALGTGQILGPIANITSTTATYQQAVYVQLVKTGNISGNKTLQFSTDNLLRMRYNCLSCTPWNIAISGQVNVHVGPSCSVKVPDQTVPLRQASVATFKGQGSTSEPSPFSIDLACSGGAPGSKVDAYVTLTDSTTLSNRSNVLTLSGVEKAAGIGVQIKYKDAIVSYGPDSNQIPNTNQWLAGTVYQAEGETLFRIPLTASYVQTAATAAGIIAGAANAKVIFNVTYN